MPLPSRVQSKFSVLLNAALSDPALGDEVGAQRPAVVVINGAVTPDQLAKLTRFAFERQHHTHAGCPSVTYVRSFRPNVIGMCFQFSYSSCGNL